MSPHWPHTPPAARTASAAAGVGRHYTLDARDVTRPSANRRPRRGWRQPPLAWADPPRGDPTWSPGAVTSSLLMTSARSKWTNQKPEKVLK